MHSHVRVRPTFASNTNPVFRIAAAIERVTTLLLTNNADGDAAKLLVKMQGLENTVLDRRGGHATRLGVRYALQTCEYDGDQAPGETGGVGL